ncbi:uncharacterized protein LOC118439160 isoform X1 [Folsomia candida]|uniref:uncharacterized protein LOC118439160 isoform X1 n=1 Tax=Folsomia candida TaxID=158441 RepID=UPI0016055BC2|nr:uncharacterized protein LOC118439160 isoform X1 [Folsomia candida]XP_035716135.1 uncharacterized protein LOC118439160 isoform X1 [Folsomia candida]
MDFLFEVRRFDYDLIDSNTWATIGVTLSLGLLSWLWSLGNLKSPETMLNNSQQSEVLAGRMGELMSGINLTTTYIQLKSLGGGDEKSVADYFWSGFSKNLDPLEIGHYEIKVVILPPSSSNRSDASIYFTHDDHSFVLKGFKSHMADEPAYLWEIDGCTFPVPVPLKAWLGVYKIAEYNATLLSLNWPSGYTLHTIAYKCQPKAPFWPTYGIVTSNVSHVLDSSLNILLTARI